MSDNGFDAENGLAPAEPAPRRSWVQGKANTPGELTNYLDPSQHTVMYFGRASHYGQPWKADEETTHVGVLRDASGIMFNPQGNEGETACAVLEDIGVRFTRIEVGWGAMSADNPDRLAAGQEANLRKTLTLFKKYHLRPLILLNSNSAVPCPMEETTVVLSRPAVKGDKVVYLKASSCAKMRPFKSGLSHVSGYGMAAEALFTELASAGSGEVKAALSRPLPKDLPAGTPQLAARMAFAPWMSSSADKSANFLGEETYAGWVQYVKGVCSVATSVMKSGGGRPESGFDVEIWNELTFGSQFLDIHNYYGTAGDAPAKKGADIERIARETVNAVRASFPGVAVDYGFSNQMPWTTGASVPPGTHSFSFHPYHGSREFKQAHDIYQQWWLCDATGKQSAAAAPTAKGYLTPFQPGYICHLPEYDLLAIQTEHQMRDLSTHQVQDHGRYTHPSWPDGSPAPTPRKWFTEHAVAPRGGDPGRAVEFGGRRPDDWMTVDEATHIQAKCLLRSLIAYTGSYVERIYFFSVRDRELGLLVKDDRPIDAAKPLETVIIWKRLLAAAAASPGVTTTVRQLRVARIYDNHGHYQFAGDDRDPVGGPPLLNRYCVRFQPFQVSNTEFLAGAWVMTRNITQVYDGTRKKGDASRFDMPDEEYEITIEGLKHKNDSSHYTLHDLFTTRKTPVTPLLVRNGAVTFRLPLTDCPRLLRMTNV